MRFEVNATERYPEYELVPEDEAIAREDRLAKKWNERSFSDRDRDRYNQNPWAGPRMPRQVIAHEIPEDLFKRYCAARTVWEKVQDEIAAIVGEEDDAS